MACSYRLAALLLVLGTTACNPAERNALDAAAEGANSATVEEAVKEEAQNVMAPFDPPAPGTPGGLPVAPTPVVEGAIDPKGPQGAAQLAQGYYALLAEKRFAEAQDLWGDHGPVGDQDPDAFTARFAGFSEIHANIGAPEDAEGAAGSLYVTVPVQLYARVKASGKPYYALRAVTLRRVNDVDGSTEAQRRWHIERIGSYPPKE